MFEFIKKNRLTGMSYQEDGSPVSGRKSGAVGWGFYALIAGAVWAVIELFVSVLYFFG